MTDDTMALIERIAKGADADLVRDLLAFAAERMMELEVKAKTGGECRKFRVWVGRLLLFRPCLV